MRRPRSRPQGAVHLALRAGVAAAALLALAASAAPEAAWAAPGLAAPGVAPIGAGPDGYFQYSLAPGASTTGSFDVTNNGAVPTTYALYAAGATTAPTSGVAYGGQGEGSATWVESWVRMSATRLPLAPGTKEAVTFTVDVPPDARPGQHVSAVVAQSPTAAGAAKPSATGASVALTTSSRVVVAVVVDVPGTTSAAVEVGRPSVRLEQPQHQLISIPMADTGDLLVQPLLTGDLRSCGTRSKVLVHFHRRLGTFVPRTAIDYPWNLRRVLQAGCYFVDVALSAPSARTARFAGEIRVDPAEAAVNGPPTGIPFTFPLPLMAAGAAALLLVLGGLAFGLRRRRVRLQAEIRE